MRIPYLAAISLPVLPSLSSLSSLPRSIPDSLAAYNPFSSASTMSIALSDVVMLQYKLKPGETVCITSTGSFENMIHVPATLHGACSKCTRGQLDVDKALKDFFIDFKGKLKIVRGGCSSLFKVVLIQNALIAYATL